MLLDVLGVFNDEIAVDLGTANTLVFVPGRGIILDEPSVVAVGTKDGQRTVLAVGKQAKSMLGRTPHGIELIQPMRDGVIADFIAAEEMLRRFIKRAKRRMQFRRPKVLVCIPASSTPVERRAVYQSALSAGARKVALIEESVAAALGAGLAIQEPKGSMIVDIGGGTTDIAVMSLGGIVDARSIRCAGNAMDEAIIKYVRRKHDLMVGEPNAERIKIQVGSAIYKSNGRHVDVQIKGRNLRHGLPTKIVLGPGEIAEALRGPLEDIAFGIQRTLEQLPPELSADIADRGICLTGGGALLNRIDSALTKLIGVKMYLSDDPRNSVIDGCGLVLAEPDKYNEFLIHPE